MRRRGLAAEASWASVGSNVAEWVLPGGERGGVGGGGSGSTTAYLGRENDFLDGSVAGALLRL